MTPKEIAEEIVSGFGVDGAEARKLSQAYLNLKKKWDALDKPSQEMIEAVKWQIGPEGKTAGTAKGICEVIIHELKK